MSDGNLPMTKMQAMAQGHREVRDCTVTFDEDSHTYTVLACVAPHTPDRERARIKDQIHLAISERLGARFGLKVEIGEIDD